MKQSLICPEDMSKLQLQNNIDNMDNTERMETKFIVKRC